MTQVLRPWLVLCVLWAGSALARDIPPLTGRVVDSAGLLSEADQQSLSQRLEAYEALSLGQQFAVLIIPSLEGDPLEEFSIRVVEAWKLGKAKQDTGLLLLIAAKDRKMRVEVGYGLEGKITDALSHRIITRVLAPAFREGAYAAGIDQALTNLMMAGYGQAPPPGHKMRPLAADREPEGLAGGWLLIVILALVLGPGFLLPLLLGSRGGRGGFGGGGFGGGFGGGGGGGFSGGGGGFGGGGSSGNW